MEKTYNAALIRRVQEYMEKHSISQNQLAAKVNLSSAALSSYLNQKYKGSVEAVERQLTEFFKINDEVAAVAEKVGGLLPREPYVPTSISEDVYQSIRFAQLEHCMVVLHGDAGVGKSKGAQKFLKDHPTNAVGISITPSTGTLSSCIKLLARALRVPECRNKMDQMLALRNRLDGTNQVIVIDEAQHLKYAALEEIRSLTDDNPHDRRARHRRGADWQQRGLQPFARPPTGPVCAAVQPHPYAAGSIPPGKSSPRTCRSCSRCWKTKKPRKSRSFC